MFIFQLLCITYPLWLWNHRIWLLNPETLWIIMIIFSSTLYRRPVRLKNIRVVNYLEKFQRRCSRASRILCGFEPPFNLVACRTERSLPNLHQIYYISAQNKQIYLKEQESMYLLCCCKLQRKREIARFQGKRRRSVVINWSRVDRIVDWRSIKVRLEKKQVEVKTPLDISDTPLSYHLSWRAQTNRFFASSVLEYDFSGTNDALRKLFSNFVKNQSTPVLDFRSTVCWTRFYAISFFTEIIIIISGLMFLFETPNMLQVDEFIVESAKW